jgi:hypothetical protein
VIHAFLLTQGLNPEPQGSIEPQCQQEEVLEEDMRTFL